MENNENFATSAENVEQTTEQIAEKTYTQADVDRMVKEKLDEVMPGKIARREAKIRKENDRMYGELVEVLKAGTGKESVEELTDTFRGFYQKKGVNIPQKPTYTDRDTQVLADAEAQDIINAGFEEVVEEVDRLSAIGLDKMTARDKAVFTKLAEYRQSTERGHELSKIGVTEDVYGSKEFNDFADQFNRSTPITKIYELYEKTKPKKEIKPMGSMTSSTVADTGVKDFYTYEEASKFTKADFDKNPALYKAVQESMTKW